MQNIKNEIRITNKVTGEITDYSYTDAKGLKNAYFELNLLSKEIDYAIRQMKSDMMSLLGDSDVIDFPDGQQIKKFYSTQVKYRKEVVRKFLDEDQLDLVLDVNGTALKSLVKEMNQSESTALPGGAWEEIEQSADVKHTAYPRVIGGK